MSIALSKANWYFVVVYPYFAVGDSIAVTKTKLRRQCHSNRRTALRISGSSDEVSRMKVYHFKLFYSMLAR